MVESPQMVVINNRLNSGSQLSRVMSKFSDIFKNHQYVAYNSVLSKSSSAIKTPFAPQSNPSSVKKNTSVPDLSSYYNTSDSELLLRQIADQIEKTLKEAKQKTLGTCRVLIPNNLVNQIAQDIIGMSESEPCGIRGCLLYISFEDRDRIHRMGQVKFGDRTIVPTFEMYLYIKRNANHWYSLLPGRLLSRFGQETIVISECYKLSKKKLFRSLSAP